MSYILNSIISKPDWTNKISDDRIINKWISELQANGIDDKKINILIKLLNQIKDNKYNIENFNWFTKLEFGIGDIFNYNCKCKCSVCKGNENEYLNDKKHCNCVTVNNNCRTTFLNKFIFHHNYYDSKTLINCIELYKTLNKSLFHHGSNVLFDVIHPSLTCYIDGVTEIINNDMKQIVDKDMLFQWLPLNANINDKNKYEFKIDSLLTDNLEHDQLITNVFQEISKIFNKMILMFNRTLISLASNNLINDAILLLESCQVIVKIQEILLTPENPTYDSSSWHLEGTKYEKIIATGIYYYDMENIEDNHLEFRTNLNEDSEFSMVYPQSCPIYVNYHYGLESMSDYSSDHDRYSHVNLGNVKTEKNMFLTFPNIMQHKVSSIKLKDKTKPGFRKILVFFLIDPRQKILSVDDVKQPELSVEDKLDYESILMYQRTYEIKNQNDIFCREINLCEH
jgi:hypothetical protein